MIAEVVVQDEYTHDVVLPWASPAGRALALTFGMVSVPSCLLLPGSQFSPHGSIRPSLASATVGGPPDWTEGTLRMGFDPFDGCKKYP